MRPWYCVHTQPLQELPVKQQLERQGWPCFAPIYLVKLKNRHIARRLLFRNYVFVSLPDPTYWPRVKNTIGVANVLTHLADAIDGKGNLQDIQYRMPSSTGSAAIETLRSQALALDEIKRDGGGRPKQSPPLQLITAGCYVRILDGMFKDAAQGQRALVDWADHERAALVLQLFGRDARIEFYLKDLERLPDQLAIAAE